MYTEIKSSLQSRENTSTTHKFLCATLQSLQPLPQEPLIPFLSPYIIQLICLISDYGYLLSIWVMVGKKIKEHKKVVSIGRKKQTKKSSF